MRGIQGRVRRTRSESLPTKSVAWHGVGFSNRRRADRWRKTASHPVEPEKWNPFSVLSLSRVSPCPSPLGNLFGQVPEQIAEWNTRARVLYKKFPQALCKCLARRECWSPYLARDLDRQTK